MCNFPFMLLTRHSSHLCTGKPTINTGHWCEGNVGEARPGVPAFVYILWPWRQYQAEGLVDQQWPYGRVLFTYLGITVWLYYIFSKQETEEGERQKERERDGEKRFLETQEKNIMQRKKKKRVKKVEEKYSEKKKKGMQCSRERDKL